MLVHHADNSDISSTSSFGPVINEDSSVSPSSTITTTVIAKVTIKSHKLKIRPRLNPRELSTKISTLLSPTLFHRRPDRAPVPPSLAFSRLPPPCAELDTAPKYRVRRFKKWRDQVPELRMALLDPRRRIHLIRYQTYALHCITTLQRGVKRKVFPRGAEVRDYAAWPSLESIRLGRATRSNLRAKASAPVDKPRSSSTFSSVPPGVTPSRTATPAKPAPNGAQRRLERTRLKQHRWVLHAENERRWREAMREVMASVVDFQGRCMLDAHKWAAGKGVWLPDFDPEEVAHLTNLFRDIRRQPSTVFNISPTIVPVKGRKEAEAAILANEAERKGRKEERKQKRATPATSVPHGADGQTIPPIPLVVDSDTKPMMVAVTKAFGTTTHSQGRVPDVFPKARRSKQRLEEVRPLTTTEEHASAPARRRSTQVSRQNTDEIVPLHGGDSAVPSSRQRRSRTLCDPATSPRSPQTVLLVNRRPSSSATTPSDRGHSPAKSTKNLTTHPSSAITPLSGFRSGCTGVAAAAPLSLATPSADQASLFRLLLQMSKSQGKHDTAARVATATVDSGRIPTTRRRPTSIVGGEPSSDQPIPSLASSASTFQTTARPLRLGSLCIDDDTMDIDTDTLVTPLTSTPPRPAANVKSDSWTVSEKNGDESDIDMIYRYIRCFGLGDDDGVPGDDVSIYLPSAADDEDTARPGSVFDTMRSY